MVGFCHRHIPTIFITDKFPPWWVFVMVGICWVTIIIIIMNRRISRCQGTWSTSVNQTAPPLPAGSFLMILMILMIIFMVIMIMVKPMVMIRMTNYLYQQVHDKVNYNDYDDFIIARVMMMTMIMMVTQLIPTSHIPTRWEYVIMMKGGNMTQSNSHYTHL